MSVNDEAWADIRRAYAEGSDSVAAIAGRAGVSASSIHRRARLEGWPRRVEAAAKSRRKSSAAKGGARSGSQGAAKSRSRSTAKPGSVVKRLYRAIDLKLKRLEERMQSSDELSAADSEREARELSSMIRSFEKVTEVAADIDKRRKPVASERKPVCPEDAERMRREIAERLERLHATGLPDTGSE